MKRVGGVVRVKPERLEEYKRLHANVWPDILAKLTECHVTNYSIFLKNDLLFSYFEYVGEDYEADMARIADDPRTQEWWDVCKPCHIPLETRTEGEWWAEMEEVFHLD